MSWRAKVKVKHLFTEDEDHESVQKNMNEVADALENSRQFLGFNTKRFRAIPAGDDFFKPTDYANKLLGDMYDYADQNRIWIE